MELTNIVTEKVTGIVDAKEFASVLNCDQATIYKRMHAGVIPQASQDGRKWVWN